MEALLSSLLFGTITTHEMGEPQLAHFLFQECVTQTVSLRQYENLSFEKNAN